MMISELCKNLELKPVYEHYSDHEASGAYTSDLLSDVMAHAGEGEILITIQAHKNTVAVASLVGSSAIIICNSRPIPDDMTQSAKDEGIPIFVTGDNQYTVSGKLYKLFN